MKTPTPDPSGYAEDSLRIQLRSATARADAAEARATAAKEAALATQASHEEAMDLAGGQCDLQWQEREREWSEKLRRAEAEAAVLRVALGAASIALVVAGDGLEDPTKDPLAAINRALSTTSGRDLLDRLRKAEVALEYQNRQMVLATDNYDRINGLRNAAEERCGALEAGLHRWLLIRCSEYNEDDPEYATKGGGRETFRCRECGVYSIPSEHPNGRHLKRCKTSRLFAAPQSAPKDQGPPTP